MAADDARGKPKATPAAVVETRKPRRVRSLGLAEFVMRESNLLPIFLRPCHCGCSFANGLPNARIGHASAQIARHDCIDIIVGRGRNVLQQRRCLHDLTRLAVPALRHTQIAPCFLNRVVRVIVKAFNSLDRNLDGRINTVELMQILEIRGFYIT